MSVPLRHAAATDIGRSRKSNEDSLLLAPPLFAVADGMGGHIAGDVASRTAVESLAREAADEGGLARAVMAANRSIFDQAQSNQDLSGMGTTITALLVKPSSAQIAHVGDSRAYLLRDGRLERLTRDHTVLERMVRQGKIRPEEAERHPQRSVLERALGVEADVEVDVRVIDTRPGDRILLCTDGLTGMLDEAEIRDILEAEEDPENASKRLVAEAVQAGGYDNVTVIVVDYAGNPADRRSPPVATEIITQATTPPSAEPPPHVGATPPESRAAGSTYPGYGRPVVVTGPPTPVYDERIGRAGPQAPPAPRRTRRRALVILGIGVAAAAVAVFGVTLAIRSSWYVGQRDGRVTIFQGVPGSFAGITMSRVERGTQIRTASLIDIEQQRVRDGIRARSLSEAEAIARSLQRAAPLAPPAPSITPTPSPAPSPTLQTLAWGGQALPTDPSQNQPLALGTGRAGPVQRRRHGCLHQQRLPSSGPGDLATMASLPAPSPPLQTLRVVQTA